MFTFARFCLATLGLVALAALLALPGGAMADKPFFSHDIVDETFPGDFCGVPATVHFQLNGHQHIFTRKGPFPYFEGNGLTRITWTNDATGATVVLFSSGNTKDLSIADNGDGTITILQINAGNTTFSSGDGSVVIRDVGHILTQYIVDYNGTPSDPFDDFLAAPPQILSEDGAHPIFGSAPIDGCAELLPAFTA
jgi:hypothetical protein